MDASTLLAVAGWVAAALALGVLASRRPPARTGGDHGGGTLLAELRGELAQQRAELAHLQGSALHDAVRTLSELSARQLAAQRAAGEEQGAVVGERLDVLGRELRRVTALVHELDAAGAERLGALDARLDQAARSTRDLASATATLREALAGARTRGQWGERMCDDVLRAAGMVEGVNYVRQGADAAGGRPDVTFLLPGDRRLHLDVKFPLDNFVRHLEASDDAAATAAKAAFVRDVRGRVRELADRAYVDPANGTLGYCLLFVPNEQVYAFAHEADAGLIDDALARRVVLCSPLTLFAVLAVVRQAVDAHGVEARSGEVLAALQRFEDEWARFTTQLDKVGRAVAGAGRAFEALEGPRRRALERELAAVGSLRDGVTAAPARPTVAVGRTDGGGEPPREATG